MGGSGNREVVVAVVEDVGLGVVGVVGGELTLGDLDGELLGGTGLEELGLLVALELDGSLLQAVGAVVVGVGALDVDECSVLAGDGAGVRDRHVDGEVVGALVDAEVGVLEAGVAQAGAEGVRHKLGVVEVAGVALAENLVLVAGLIVAIAHIDALDVDVLVAPVVTVELGGRPLVALGGDLRKHVGRDLGEVGVDVAEVGHGGNSLVVLVDGVGQATGGVHLAGEDVNEYRGAGEGRGIAGGRDVAEPQQRVDSVGPGAILPADVVGRGHEHDHLGEGACAT